MIVVDIETSGAFDPVKNGIWQIGAVEFGNTENTFLQEARIDDTDGVEKGALKVTGKTEEELRDKSKQSQKQLLENFFTWVGKIENKVIVAHNTQFDWGFLSLRAKKYNLEFPFGYRVLDLHSIGVAKYLEVNGKLPFEGEKSVMNLSKVLEFCGMEDRRIQLKEGEVIKEGSPHNALEDAKFEAECLSRLLYGKIMFSEFEKLPVPEKLRNL